MNGEWLQRVGDEVFQAKAVAFKDVRVYYLRSGVIAFGLLMPFFLFFSFSVRREMAADQSVSRLLALTILFTAAAAGPFIIPLERRLGTYDRLLVAPMSLITLLLAKTSVGVIFACAVSIVATVIGVIIFGVTIAQPLLLLLGLLLGTFCFSALGLIFGSVPTRNPGDVQMPSTLLRWGLLFVSGVFIPLEEMAPLARAIAYFSPLTYAQDLITQAVMGVGVINIWVDVIVLLLAGILFLLPSLYLHRRSRKLGF